MSNLLSATSELVSWLQGLTEHQLQNPALTRNDHYCNWLSEAYAHPDFFFTGDYFLVTEATAKKDLDSLTLDETRARITFVIRQMRHEYAPYSAIVDGTLCNLLIRYLELTDQNQQEEQS